MLVPPTASGFPHESETGMRNGHIPSLRLECKQHLHSPLEALKAQFQIEIWANKSAGPSKLQFQPLMHLHCIWFKADLFLRWHFPKRKMPAARLTFESELNVQFMAACRFLWETGHLDLNETTWEMVCVSSFKLLYDLWRGEKSTSLWCEAVPFKLLRNSRSWLVGGEGGGDIQQASYCRCG